MQGIADYEFIRPLGSGNHGQFFLARRPARLPIDVEYVAVKVLGGESTADTFRRATGEMKAFASVQSPYLVPLYDAGQHDRIFYYSMEYLPEGSLAQPAHPLDQTAVLRAMCDVARAAATLHAVGIVHSDIKPSNVLLTTVGAKLSDLGLSQVFTPGVTLTAMGRSRRWSSPIPISCTASHPARTTMCGRSASPAPALAGTVSTATCRRTTDCSRCAGSCQRSRRSLPRSRLASRQSCANALPRLQSGRPPWSWRTGSRPPRSDSRVARARPSRRTRYAAGSPSVGVGRFTCADTGC